MNAAPDPIRRYRLSVADYHRMGEAGVFREGARVELIEGEIVDMAPIGSRHAGFVNRLSELFFLAAAGKATVTVQNPVVLGERSEPQPDLCLLRRRDDFYTDSHALAEDILLAVEVADTSLQYDRKIKAPLYARHGIPELWLIDVEKRRLIVYGDPGPDGYRDETVSTRPGMSSPTALPGVSVDLTGLFRAPGSS